jgi:hypothetical protein
MKMKEFKVTSEDFTKLVGPGGERFTSEAEWREPKQGDWYLLDGKACLALSPEYSVPRHVLTRAKTARGWLSELPGGWREEALAGLRGGDVCASNLALSVSLLRFAEMPSGRLAWIELLTAVQDGTPLPPHPSKAKPKVERVKAEKDNGYLCADGRCLSVWPTYATFRGAVYIHPASGAERAFGFTHPLFIREFSTAQEWDWSHARTKQHTTMLWPSFIEVER